MERLPDLFGAGDLLDNVIKHLFVSIHPESYAKREEWKQAEEMEVVSCNLRAEKCWPSI
jgi:hypothetical protein